MDAKLDRTSNEYQLCILLRRPTLIKFEDTLKSMLNMLFNVYSIIINVGPLKIMDNGYSLDVEFNSESNVCLHLKFE